MADTAVTLLGTRKSVLADVEAIRLGFNFKATIPYSDVALGTGSTDTVTVTLGSTPALWLVDKAMVNVTTAYAGTTAMNIQVGTTTTTTGFITATSVLTAGVLQPATGIGTLNVISSGTATASKSIVAIFTNATGGSPSALTAGSVDIYLSITNCTGAALGGGLA